MSDHSEAFVAFGWRADQREVTHWNCWTGIGESAPFAKIVTKSYVIFI